MTMHDHWPDPHIQEVAHLNQTIALLQQRLTEQEQETRHWLDVVKKQLKVISICRQAVAWWASVCDRYPRLTAPWVASMNVALSELASDG